LGIGPARSLLLRTVGPLVVLGAAFFFRLRFAMAILLNCQFASLLFYVQSDVPIRRFLKRFFAF
jgi:hypothetical protein